MCERDSVFGIKYLKQSVENAFNIFLGSLETNCEIVSKEMGISDHLVWTPEKSVCSSRGQQLELDLNNRLVPNWERSMSRLYIVTLFI